MSGRAEAAGTVGEETMRPGTRVLMVEDDRYKAELVTVLDVMLPGLDGVGLLKRLRAGGSRVPVVMR